MQHTEFQHHSSTSTQDVVQYSTKSLLKVSKKFLNATQFAVLFQTLPPIPHSTPQPSWLADFMPGTLC